MADVGFLTPSDVAVLRRLLAREARAPRGEGAARDSTAGNLEHHDTSGPDVYVARVPAGGVPALAENQLRWTGTGTLTHAGTGTELLEDDVPGWAYCTVWKAVWLAGRPRLLPVFAEPKRVLNVSTSAVPGDTWVVIKLDRRGDWYAEAGGGGGALDVCGDPKTYEQSILDAHGGTGTGSNEECPVYDAFEELHTVDALKLWYEDFVTEFLSSADCGGGGTGTGSGTGTGAAEGLRRTAKVRTRGFTGVVQVGKGDPVICDDCTIVETQVFLCYHDGLLQKRYEVPQHCP